MLKSGKMEKMLEKLQHMDLMAKSYGKFTLLLTVIWKSTITNGKTVTRLAIPNL